MFNFFRKKTEPQTLCFSTDIHCHIIPGIDDGSPDATTSADLVERMQSWGISRILATPHVTDTTFENTPESMDNALAKLRKELDARGNGIEITHSAEYRLDDLFLTHLDNGILVPYPNNYLLVENSFVQEAFNLDQILFNIKVKGFKPILAHPERYNYYYGKKGRYEQIHSTGTLFQINVLSLAGYYGKEEKNIAEWLLQHGMVDFLGTDLHNHRHADAIEAYLSSKDYRRNLEALRSYIKNDRVF